MLTNYSQRPACSRRPCSDAGAAVRGRAIAALVALAIAAYAPAFAVDPPDRDEVGSIRPGLRADLLVLSGDDDRPYRALIEASPLDVELVLIGGVPVYGAGHSMRFFWKASELQEIDVGHRRKALAGPAARLTFSDVVSRLQAALVTQGLPLAPLTETGSGPSGAQER